MELSADAITDLGDWGCNIEDENRGYFEELLPDLRLVREFGNNVCPFISDEARKFVVDVRLARWDYDDGAHAPDERNMVPTSSRAVADELGIVTWRCTAEEAAAFILDYVIGDAT